MNILIIGGSGFIGQHLINSLCHKYNLTVSTRSSGKNQVLDQGKVNFLKVDICDRNQVFSAVSNMDIVIHLASSTTPSTSNNDCVFDVNSNLIGSLNILDACVAHKVKKIIFSSSGGTVYGDNDGNPLTENSQLNPICSYGIVKVAIESYIKIYYKKFGLAYAILRISNPYGSGQNIKNGFGVISTFMKKMINGETIEIWGDGTISRDFIYISDLINSFDFSITSKVPDLLLNVGSGESATLNQVLHHLKLVLNCNPNVKYLNGRSFDVKNSCLDIKKAKLLLGWQPLVSLSEGLTLMSKEFY